MLKRLIFFLFTLFSCFIARGSGDTLNTPGNWSIGFKLQEGFIMAHHPTLVYLQHQHVKGFEINYMFPTHGETDWHQQYNFPMLGFIYQFYFLGNKKELGNGHSLCPMIYFPLLHRSNLRLLARLGVGVGYVDKPFRLKDNYKNLAIGSNINAAVTTGIQFRMNVQHKTQFNIGIDLSHYSNGASEVPNQGLNLATFNFGITQYFGNASPLVRRTIAPYDRKFHSMAYLDFGVKDLYPPGGRKYAVMGISSDIYKHVCKKSIIGAGADLFLDQSLKTDLASDSIFLNTWAAAPRFGLHGMYGLVVGRCMGLFETGYYLYNKDTIYGNIYSQLSLRYFFKERLFANFSLKSHFARADYFLFGIGYRLS